MGGAVREEEDADEMYIGSTSDFIGRNHLLPIARLFLFFMRSPAVALGTVLPRGCTLFALC